MRAFVPLLLAGCAIAVRPPADPKDPVTVMLVDHGRHSSLVLPRKGGSVEFAYGEWEWFAKMNDPWYRVFPSMFWPTQGTLGRRLFDHPPDHALVRSQIPCEERFLIEVERDRAEALLERLNDRFEKHRNTELHNSLYRLTFVHDDDSYGCLYQCNHATGEWLEELGCTVSGAACSAKFSVRAPE